MALASCRSSFHYPKKSRAENYLRWQDSDCNLAYFTQWLIFCCLYLSMLAWCCQHHCVVSLEVSQLDNLINEMACTPLSEGRTHTVAAYKKVECHNNKVQQRCHSSWQQGSHRHGTLSQWGRQNCETENDNSAITRKSASWNLVCLAASSADYM